MFAQVRRQRTEFNNHIDPRLEIQVALGHDLRCCTSSHRNLSDKSHRLRCLASYHELYRDKHRELSLSLRSTVQSSGLHLSRPSCKTTALSLKHDVFASLPCAGTTPTVVWTVHHHAQLSDVSEWQSSAGTIVDGGTIISKNPDESREWRSYKGEHGNIHFR